MPRNKDIHKVLVIGSGPIIIGQAAEFDYAGTQACRSLKEEGMEVVSDNNAIEAIVDKVIASNEKAVSDFKSGKTNVLGWLVGQVMKESHGKANPGMAKELVEKKLSAL